MVRVKVTFPCHGSRKPVGKQLRTKDNAACGTAAVRRVTLEPIMHCLYALRS